MLQNIRDRLSGPFVWVVVGIIAVPFAFFGIETFNTGGADPSVVEVGDAKISESQVQQSYENRVRQYQEMLGENFRMDMINPVQVRQGVVDEMVQEAVLREHAKDAGYSSSNADIVRTLGTIPAFQKDGRFDRAIYQEALSQRGRNLKEFEAQLRDNLTVEQVRDAVLGSAFVTPAESAAAWRLSQQERSFATATIKASALETGLAISDDEVAKSFATNASKYQALERMKVAYVELALDGLPPAGSPDTVALKALYDADVASFSTPEERRASHILVNIGGDAAAAKTKAEDIKAKLDGGADFATLAKELSDDSGSKTAGGDLGFMRKGQLTPKFDEALFGIPAIGGIAGPVETEFGFHVIKLAELKAAAVQPLESPEVQAKLLEAYRKKDAEVRFRDLSEKLEQLAFESAGSLDAAAKGVGATVQTTDWFSRGQGAGLTGNTAFQTAAFSDEVLKDGENSKPVTLAPNRIAVLRKAAYEPARPLKLEEVREAVRQELKTRQARAKAESQADALIAAAKTPGAVFADLATAQGFVVAAPVSVKRRAEGQDASLLSAAFRLPRPAASGRSYGKVTLASGDVAVIALDAVRDGTPAPGQPDFTREAGQYKDALAGLEFAGFRSALEKNIGVKRDVAPAADPAAAVAATEAAPGAGAGAAPVTAPGR